MHPSAFIDDGVELGEGTSIWHVSHILEGSRLGKHCRIGQNVVIGPRVTVGDNVKIQNNVSVYEGVTLESDVFCGPSMVFTNVLNPRSAVPRMKDLPPLDIHLLDRPDLPSVGAGETPLIAVAPAIANAVFDATGVRLRQMPLRLPAQA